MSKFLSETYLKVLAGIKLTEEEEKEYNEEKDTETEEKDTETEESEKSEPKETESEPKESEPETETSDDNWSWGDDDAEKKTTAPKSDNADSAPKSGGSVTTGSGSETGKEYFDVPDEPKFDNYDIDGSEDPEGGATGGENLIQYVGQGVYENSIYKLKVLAGLTENLAFDVDDALAPVRRNSKK
jgi:outer membrane biosynthesis protein TonB